MSARHFSKSSSGVNLSILVNIEMGAVIMRISQVQKLKHKKNKSHPGGYTALRSELQQRTGIRLQVCTLHCYFQLLGMIPAPASLSYSGCSVTRWLYRKQLLVLPLSLSRAQLIHSARQGFIPWISEPRPLLHPPPVPQGKKGGSNLLNVSLQLQVSLTIPSQTLFDSKVQRNQKKPHIQKQRRTQYRTSGSQV